MSSYLFYDYHKEGKIMNYEIVELEEKLVEGIAIRTTNENGKSMGDIANLWQKFFEQGIYQTIENKINGKTIGLYTNYEGDYTKPYQFLTCVEVSSKSKEQGEKVTQIIPKGKYAKFTITGDVLEAVGQLWGEIWNMDLDRKYTCDFEEYQNTSDDMKNQEIYVYIALN